MDKEVIDKVIEFIKSSQCKYDGWDKLFEICKYIYNLKQQCRKQKEVIDKAIEYIKKAQLGEFSTGVIYWLKDDEIGKILLQILEDKEV